MKRPRLRSTTCLAALALALLSTAQTIDPSLLKGMEWRNLGPFRGGRVSAVTGALGQPGVFYIGLPQGGVWKTTSAGQTWYPVFDAIKETSCVGSVTVAPSNSDVIYAGTGEISGDGDGWGVYKSTDAGKTWQHLGLQETRLIPSILVDPKDPNTVLLAAGGTRKKLSDQRGVFRSSDGGQTWSKTLYIDDETGVAHLSWAFDRPDIVLATTQRRYSGPDSKGTKGVAAIYKSTDQGKTWKKLEGKGLPRLFGRFTTAIAQHTEGKRMFVIGMFGLYRSDDGGDNWRKMAVGDQRIANGQGNYTSGVYVDSQNPDIVYTLATCVYRSLDGGVTFEGFKGAPGGDDPQQLWIDPTNGSRILYGGDQGATVSLDAGATWGSWYNQPTAQVYHIATDNRYPYWVYATQQDSGVVGTASRGNLGQITPLDWIPHPLFEFGYVTVDPLDPNVSYALSPAMGIGKVTYPSGQWTEAGPAVDASEKLRFGIMLPLAFSPSNPHELMAGFQYLMSTTDGGKHWKKLSPDLAERTVPKDKDGKTPTASPGRLGSITSFSECTADPKVIWVGTTNGLIQVTHDRGATWKEVSVPLPDAARQRVTCIEASHHDPATAYVTFNGAGESKPLVFRTHDFGRNWKAIDEGLPKEEPWVGPASVIRADTVRKGLLFTGNDSMVSVSFDDGDHWQSLMLNLPTTQMNDLQIKGNDLVLGTYGRGLWVLDDISPLREVKSEDLSGTHLYKPAEAVRVRRNVNGDTPFPPEVPHAKNPPLGAVIYYTLSKPPTQPITLEIIDAKGKVVRHMSSAPIVPYADPKPEIAPYWIGKRKPMPTELGLNRVNWDIRHDDPPAFVHDVQDVINATVGDTPEAVPGPLALPGTYTARLTVDGQTMTQTFTVVNDPRSPAKFNDLRDQHDLQLSLVSCAQASWDAYQQIADMRAKLADLAKSDKKDVAEAAKNFDSRLSSLAGKIVYTRRFGMGGAASNFVDLNIGILQNLSNIDGGDAVPSVALWNAYGGVAAETTAMLDRWRALNGKDLDALNAVLTKNGLPILAASPALSNPTPAPSWVKTKKVSGAPRSGNLDPEALERQLHGEGEPEDADND